MERQENGMRCAGIVTYNPDIARLRSNIAAIAPQVNIVFIYDNGSNNAEAIRALVQAEFTTVVVEWSDENKGIATALNRLLQAAASGGYERILFLDQDSVASEGMCDELASHFGPGIALVCPFILDRNRMTVEDYRNDTRIPPLERLRTGARHGAITSGSLVDVQAAQMVGGFDDTLFIDYVDFDFNERLLLNGYVILRDNRAYLIHEKGKSERTPFAVPRRDASGSIIWKPLFKLGYSPMRCYYQTRNRILYWKKYRRWTKSEGLTEIPLLMMLSLLFEDMRWSKLRAYVRGIKDGAAAKTHPYTRRRS